MEPTDLHPPSTVAADAPSSPDLDSDRSQSNFLHWNLDRDTPQPPSPSSLSFSSFFRSTLVPRPVAWCSVDNNNDNNNDSTNNMLTLLDGFTAGGFTPPILYFAATAWPAAMVDRLRETRRCTLSVATLHETSVSALETATTRMEGIQLQRPQQPLDWDALGLTPAAKRGEYPRAVQDSPIHMYCSLEHFVELNSNNGNGNDEAMIVLTVETFVVNGSVLSDPTERMLDRSITAKIDAALIQPVASLGDGRFRTLAELRSMPRPQKKESSAQWTSTDFTSVVLAGPRKKPHTSMEWNFRTDGRSCPLGFNPVTALILPRPIGWISTYSKNEPRVLHLAPYSFFIDVSRNDTEPMVAFSSYRKEGSIFKDAHKDSVETGFFCFNLCNEDLAVAMNYTAAELGRNESEFALATLEHEGATLVDAPTVRDAPVKYECEYVKSIDVGSFSIVIGRVKGVSIDRRILSKDGSIDVEKLRPISRLGYMDEYGIFTKK